MEIQPCVHVCTCSQEQLVSVLVLPSNEETGSWQVEEYVLFAVRVYFESFNWRICGRQSLFGHNQS
jgi:hypothetical protein